MKRPFDPCRVPTHRLKTTVLEEELRDDSNLIPVEQVGDENRKSKESRKAQWHSVDLKICYPSGEVTPWLLGHILWGKTGLSNLGSVPQEGTVGLSIIAFT